MNTSDASQRLGRLKAMQARRRAAMGEAEVVEATPVAAPARAAKTGGGAAAEGKAAAGGKRNAILQRLRKFVTGPDGSVDQKKAKGLIQYLKKQASDPNSPRHEQAKKALEAFKKMEPETRRKLLGGMARAGGGGGQAAGGGAGRRAGGAGGGGRAAKGGAAQGGGDGSWFDDLVEKI